MSEALSAGMVNLADDLTPETLPARLEMAEVQAALEAAQLGNWRGWQAKMDLVKFGLLSFLPDPADDAKRPGTGKTAPLAAAASDPALPNHPNVESGLLGTLILNPGEIKKTAETLTGRDFHSVEKGRVFNVLRDMAERGDAINLVTVELDFERRKMSSLLRTDLLQHCMAQVVSPDAIPHFASVLRKDADDRALILAVREISAGVGRGGSAADALKAVREMLDERLDQAGGDDDGFDDGAASWPSPLRPEAFSGPAGDLVRLVDPATEADPAAILVQFLVMFGNLIGRGPHWVTSDTPHYANLFACVVGRTSMARKGTGLNVARYLFRKHFKPWLSSCVYRGVASGEAVVHVIRDATTTDPGVPDKRAMWEESEFQNVIAVMGREGSKLSGYLRQAWDGGSLENSTRHEPSRVAEPHVSVIGHITLAELRRKLPANEVSNGFANRFLWCCSRRSKILPEGGDFGKLDFAPLSAAIADAVHFAGDPLFADIPIVFDADAQAEWNASLYHRLTRDVPGTLGEVTDRAAPMVRRLAMIYALLERSPRIGLRHLHAALAVWDYCYDSAKFIFGGQGDDPVSQRILEALRDSGKKGLSRNHIGRTLFHGKRTKAVDRSLQILAQQGMIVERVMPHQGPGRGRPAKVWALSENA